MENYSFPIQSFPALLLLRYVLGRLHFQFLLQAQLKTKQEQDFQKLPSLLLFWLSVPASLRAPYVLSIQATLLPAVVLIIKSLPSGLPMLLSIMLSFKSRFPELSNLLRLF